MRTRGAAVLAVLALCVTAVPLASDAADAVDTVGSGTADDPFTSFQGTPVMIVNKYVRVNSPIAIYSHPNQGIVAGAGNAADFGLAFNNNNDSITGTVSKAGDIVFLVRGPDGSAGNVTVHAVELHPPSSSPVLKMGTGTQQDPLIYILDVGIGYEFGIDGPGTHSSLRAWGEGTQTLGGTLVIGNSTGGFFSSFAQGEPHSLGQNPVIVLKGTADGPFTAKISASNPRATVWTVFTTEAPDLYLVAGSARDLAMSPSLNGCTYSASGLDGHGTVTFDGDIAHISVADPGDYTLTVTMHKGGHTPRSVDLALHVSSALSPTNSPANGVIAFVI